MVKWWLVRDLIFSKSPSLCQTISKWPKLTPSRVWFTDCYSLKERDTCSGCAWYLRILSYQRVHATNKFDEGEHSQHRLYFVFCLSVCLDPSIRSLISYAGAKSHSVIENTATGIVGTLCRLFVFNNFIVKSVLPSYRNLIIFNILVWSNFGGVSTNYEKQNYRHFNWIYYVAVLS